MATGHNQASEGREAARSPIGRRGILAVAAAAVAGIVAKQASQPVVAAAFALQGDFDNLAGGNTNIHGVGAVPT